MRRRDPARLLRAKMYGTQRRILDLHMLGRAEGRNPLWDRLWDDLERLIAEAERDGVTYELDPAITALRDRDGKRSR